MERFVERFKKNSAQMPCLQFDRKSDYSNAAKFFPGAFQIFPVEISICIENFIQTFS